MDELGDKEAEQGLSAGQWVKAGRQEQKKNGLVIVVSPDNHDDTRP